MQSQNLYYRAFVIAGLLLFLVFNFQNCGKPVAFNDTDSASLGTTYYDLGSCKNGCWNNEIPAATNTAKPNVKVVVVMDNSSSMSKEQSQLATGSSGLIDDLAGLDTSFYLYTTTQEPTGVGTTTSESAVCTDMDSSGNYVTCNGSQQAGHTYTNSNVWSLQPNLLSSPLHISSDASSTDFATAKTTLSNAIVGIGTTGTPNEQGICTVARTVYATGANAIFGQTSPSSGDGNVDVAAFLIISDDNDHTLNSDGTINAQCHSHDDTVTTCTNNQVANSGTQACTTSACTSYNYLYTSSLSGTPTPDSVNYTFTKNNSNKTLTINYQTQAPPSATTTYSYTYSKGNVNVTYQYENASFDGNVWTYSTPVGGSKAMASVSSCTNFSVANTCASFVANTGLSSSQVLVPNSCNATCTAASPAPSSSFTNTSASCSYPASGTNDCSSDSVFTSKMTTLGKTALSCSATCDTQSFGAVSQTYGTTYNPATCPSGTSCTATQLSYVDTATNYVSGSCNVTCGNSLVSGTLSAVAPSLLSTCAQVQALGGSNPVCPAGAQAYLESLGDLGSSDVLDTCNVSCTSGHLNGTSASMTVKQYVNVDNGTNYCNSPYKDPKSGVTYTNIVQYFESQNAGMTSGTCVQSQGTPYGPNYDQVPVGGTHTVMQCSQAPSAVPYSFPPNKPIFSGEDPKDGFVTQATQLFGSNYLVSAIVTTQVQQLNGFPYNGADVSVCASYSPTSFAPVAIGQRYMNLVNLFSAGVIGSVCDPDYGTSLSKISQWVKQTVSQIYQINDLIGNPTATVIAVWIDRGGFKIPMVIGTDVEIQGTTIKFLSSGTVQGSDLIGYTIANGQP